MGAGEVCCICSILKRKAGPLLREAKPDAALALHHSCISKPKVSPLAPLGQTVRHIGTTSVPPLLCLCVASVLLLRHQGVMPA